MRVNKAKLRTDIKTLFELLSPYGVTKPVHLATLIHDPNEPHFPSDAYVRLMLSASETPSPSERFCSLFYTMFDYVNNQLTTDDTNLVALIQGLGIRRDLSYDPSARLCFIVIPEKMKRVCLWNECGISFVGTPSENYCCKRHNQLAKNKRRRDQRRARRAQGVVQLAEAA